MPQNSHALTQLEKAKPSPISWLFTAAIFVGSALLFLVQPMVAKMLLPTYGGTPAVWNTSMVFFQAALLIGYGYAHLSFKHLGPRIQPVVHLVLLGSIFLLLPIAFGQPDISIGGPSNQLLAQLAAGVGLPFVIVAAGAPLLQRWYAATGGPGSNDPYFLYAASNAASILALLAYPLVLEPLLPLMGQSGAWQMGYGLLIALVVACAAVVLLPRQARSDSGKLGGGDIRALTARQVCYWVALSFVPSSLLLGVTTYLTTNIASAPLLWVIPLVIYLLTFVIAFSSGRRISSFALGRVVAMLIAPMTLVIVLEATDPILALGSLHLLVFGLGALMCHTRLNETRPDHSHLTAFYFWISVGGVLGGIFNALLAPVFFDSVAEYPIALVALVMLIPRESAVKFNWMDLAVPIGIGALTGVAVLICDAIGMGPSPARTALTLGIPALTSFVFAERPVRYGLSLGAVFLAARIFNIGATGELLLSERSFYGVHRVLLTDKGRFRELMHGNTIHGKQSVDPAKARTPLTYYHPTGPMGQVFEKLHEKGSPQNVALVGLGVGSLAAYGRKGDGFTFYEIDPDVIYIARDSGLFTFLRDSAASVSIMPGDARLSLWNNPSGSLSVLVLDAFSSDAIPTHLLTLEAIKLYKEKMARDGIMAFHVSNRYLDLKPVLAAAGRELGLVGLYQDDLALTDQETAEGKYRSTWVLLAKSPEPLDVFYMEARWNRLTSTPGDKPWTDDFSNLVEAFLARQRQRD